jgi:hypothetical protein
MHVGKPTALIQTRTNLLPATLTGMEKPLGSTRIGGQDSICLVAKGAVTRFHRNWHKELLLQLEYSSTITAEVTLHQQSRWYKDRADQSSSSGSV